MDSLARHSIWRTIAIAIVPYLVWRLLKRSRGKDPLADIPGPAPDNWLTGSFMKIFPMDSGGWEYHDGLVREYGKTFKFKGLMGADVLYTYDERAVYHIVLKDQHSWEETREFVRTNGRIFGIGLFSTMGEHHRRQRKLLNPVFSAAHIRDLTPTFYSVTQRFTGSLAQLVSEGEKEIDLLPWLTRTALELVAQSGFGYSFDTLEPDAREHPFAKTLKNLLCVDPGLVAARNLIFPYVYNLGTPRFQRAVVNALPWKKLHELRDMVDLTHKTSLEILEATRRAVGNGGNKEERIAGGKDIMTFMANMEASQEDRLPEDELIALISTMIFAAMDTTSNALSRLLVVLAQNPEVQDKLREEVVQSGEGLDYDTITGLPYLDAICRETLRLYSPIPFVFREAGEANMVLPLLNPITTTDGRKLQNLVVPKHTVVLIQITQQNKDPDVWGPDATEWKPERWLSPLPLSVADARVPGIYSNILTFFGGSRSCIGFKFAQLEMKIVLSELIRNFRFTPGDKEIIWQLMPIVTPTTQDAKLTPAGVKTLRLPLNVKCIR
ncbi:cytochrome P450 [Coprinellus micaceus]|uniref:Cytochrome P450 n=1 Tax=Coprinellus micaceus TaxID=71717 RepID=A0A4Y7SWW2_COPMI|nr:cytochrome P450 [Coprinellus micaceus]